MMASTDRKPTAADPAVSTTAPETGDNASPAQAMEPDELHGRHGEEDIDDDPYGSDAASSTASISSSIFAYRTLQGRTFHSNLGNAEYWGANDEPQNEALDIIHHVLTLLLDGELHRAPIDSNASLNVLDVGTGTGLWAIDFGDKYPSATVIGTDISPIQPNWVPPNVSFEIDDCTLPWTFARNSFDFIHIRWLFGSIIDWDALYREAFAALKPGGWIESHEAATQFCSDDGTVTEDSAMGQFGKFFAEGGKKLGRSMTVVEDEVQRKGIEAAGFTNIHEENFKSPLGPWPKNPRLKEMGRFQHLATARDVHGTLLYMGNLMGWLPEELEVYAAKLKSEFRDPKIHGYYWQKIVWAQKPM